MKYPINTNTDEIGDNYLTLYAWRARTLSIALIIVSVASLPAYISVIVNAIQHGHMTWLEWVYVAIYLASISLALLPRLNPALRGWGLMALTYTHAAASFARLGLVGSGRLWLVVMPVIATTIIGPSAGYAMAALSLFIYVLFAALAHLGILGNWLVLQSNPLTLGYWIEGGAALVIFLVTVVTLVERFGNLQMRTLAINRQTNAKLSQITQASRENESRLRAIFEAAKDVSFIMTDLAGTEAHILEFSPGAERIFGYSREEMIGKPVAILHLPEDVARFPVILEAIHQSKAGFTGESMLVRKSGERFPALFTTYPIFGDENTMVAALGVSLDITERKRAEQSLRESEEKYRGIVEKSYDGILLIDETGIVFEWNRGMEQLTGLKRDDVVGQPAWDILSRFASDEMKSQSPERLEQLQVSLKEFARTGQSPWLGKVIEVRLQRTDGNVRITQEVNFAIETERGFMHGSVFRDITENRQAEESLREREARLRFITDNMLDMITQTGPDRFIRYASPSVKRHLGYDPQDLIGKSVFDFVHLDDIDRLLGVVRPAIQHQVSSLQIEYRYRHAEGYYLWLESVVTLLYDDTGHYLGAIFGTRDITERKRMGESLRQANLVVENSPVVLFRWKVTEGWPVALVSKNVTQFGYTPEELLSGAVLYSSMVHPEDLKRIAHEVQEYGDRGVDHFQQEYRLVTKDRKIRWVDDRTLIERDADGRITHYQGIVIDITDRKQAEEALRESAEQYRIITSTAMDGFVVTDLGGRLLDVNEAYCRITGYSRDELLKMSVRDIEAIETSDDIRKRIQKVVEIGPDRFESRHRRKDGRIIDVEVNMTFMRQSGQLLVFLRDISERKQAEVQLERNLRETRVRFNVSQALAGAETEDEVLDMLIQHAGLYPQAHMSILTFDRTGNELAVILRRQDTFESGLIETLPTGARFPASSFTTINLLSADQPAVSNDVLAEEGVDPASREMFRSGGAASYGVFPLTAGNEWMGYIGVTAKSTGYFDDEKQHLYQTLAELGAVTLRAARLRETIRESQQRLSLLVQQSPLAVIEWNIDFQAVSWNPAAERIFGYTREEALGRHATSLIVPEQARPLVDQVWQALLAQKGGTYNTNANMTKDGRLITCEWFNAPLVGADGQVIGVAGLAQDITDRKLAEAEREKLIAELEVKNAELERFTYTVSHDLKSPLVTIRGFLGFLEQDATKGDLERLRKDMQRIREATDTMHQLLNQLLELSRIGRLINPPQKVAFGDIVQDALARVASRIAERNVQVTVTSPLPQVYGDRPRLVEVVQNLVENAIKFMGDQPAPRLDIGMQPRGQEMVWYVADNGIGIDPRYQEKVFGLFERLDPTIEGTGVGLAIVKRIIEVHGGRIGVESEGLGRGSTFYFTLPPAPGGTL
jgi:PAS domain S-box-containing protein